MCRQLEHCSQKYHMRILIENYGPMIWTTAYPSAVGLMSRFRPLLPVSSLNSLNLNCYNKKNSENMQEIFQSKIVVLVDK
jgi:hypothetical protein